MTLIFRQLFEQESSTYTYVLGCSETRQAVLVDPVLETFARDLDVLRDLGLELIYTLDTHVHADHLTAAAKLRALTSCKIAVPTRSGVDGADMIVAEDAPLRCGHMEIQALFTPGHTDHHHCYRIDGGGWEAVLTGDCLLIDGCGRTDFQSGSSDDLYRSVHDKLFCLPRETLVYPGHDYKGAFVSSIAQEKTRNPRLNTEVSIEEFADIMANLHLPYPKKIDMAVPANLRCGQCPDDVPEGMQKLCDLSVQG